MALLEFGLVEVFPVLKENDVDYDSLLLLVEDDFKDLEIKLGTRKKVKHLIPFVSCLLVQRCQHGLSLAVGQDD